MGHAATLAESVAQIPKMKNFFRRSPSLDASPVAQHTCGTCAHGIKHIHEGHKDTRTYLSGFPICPFRMRLKQIQATQSQTKMLRHDGYAVDCEYFALGLHEGVSLHQVLARSLQLQGSSIPDLENPRRACRTQRTSEQCLDCSETREILQDSMHVHQSWIETQSSSERATGCMHGSSQVSNTALSMCVSHGWNQQERSSHPCRRAHWVRPMAVRVRHSSCQAKTWCCPFWPASQLLDENCSNMNVVHGKFTNELQTETGFRIWILHILMQILGNWRWTSSYE